MTPISSELVADRLDDWACRLESLYDTLDAWMDSASDVEVRRGTTRQAVEPLMRRFAVPPRDLPTYTISQGNRRTTFIPSALWVAGANGRVDITTPAKQHILVDRGDSEHGSKWQLVVDDFKRLLVPFTRAQLVRLMAEGE